MPQRRLNGKNGAHKRNRTTRPITTKRDYANAAEIVEELRSQEEPENVAERRMQAFIREMEQYDHEIDDEYASDFLLEDEYDGPFRRWANDPNDLD